MIVDKNGWLVENGSYIKAGLTTEIIYKYLCSGTHYINSILKSLRIDLNKDTYAMSDDKIELIVSIALRQLFIHHGYDNFKYYNTHGFHGFTWQKDNYEFGSSFHLKRNINYNKIIRKMIIDDLLLDLK